MAPAVVPSRLALVSTLEDDDVHSNTSLSRLGGINRNLLASWECRPLWISRLIGTLLFG